MSDEVRAVIESIKKENERAKLMEESKNMSSRESEKGKVKNDAKDDKEKTMPAAQEKLEEQKV